MFRKLISNYVFESFNVENLLYRFGENTPNQFNGISYFNIDSNIYNSLLQIINPLKRQQYRACYMATSCSLPPHKDNGTVTTINFYINTDNGITSFYNLRENVSPKYFKLPNQTTGLIYDIECLEEIGSFTASPGDVWVLNVEIPHGVSVEGKQHRTGLCLQTKLSFNEVLNDLII